MVAAWRSRALLVAAILLGVAGNAGLAAAQVAPTLVTAASPSVEVGGQIFDNANLLGAANATGTITFNLYGPGDVTCTVPIFTSTVPVTGTSVNSQPFTTSQAGVYRWTATYSGDANFLPVGPTPCNDPAEAVEVTRAVVVLTTVASPHAGGTIHDTATLAGGFNPTGTITFDLYGPGDTFCAAAPVFTSTVPVAGNGSYDSGSFAPPVSGTYRWRATYSGDANNLGEGPTACVDPAETVDVIAVVPTPTLTTTASGPVTVGGVVRDTATLSGGTNPTGTITFNLYGPDDATCSGPVAFTSTVPVAGNGTYTSADFAPVAPGTYRWRATYSGDANNPVVGPTACTDPAETVVVTSVPSTVTLATSASGSVPVGGQLFDTATLAGATNPTGTITFDLYGPADPTCVGPPVFTSTVPIAGNGAYPSGSFTPTSPGTYRWRAAYSGDANNPAVGPTACADPAETVVVTGSSPSLVTNASAAVPVGGTIRDTATLIGGTNPTGTITFDLYGPDDATCSAPVAFTSTVPVAGNGNYDSSTFTATQAGTYRWRATYSGDANNNPAGPTACADPAETVVVTAVLSTVTLATNASGSVPVGGQLTDTATLAGGTTATGTVTFTLYGPDDATCSGAVAFTSTVPVAGNGSYTSGAFTPTVAGTYRWRAAYSGDANNAAAGPTACDDPAEAVVVTNVVASITVAKTANPTTRAEPGGMFTFGVVVTNTGPTAVTLTSLSDDVYGDLAGRDSCATGAVLAPNGGQYHCSFSGSFTGTTGASQTDTVRATASVAGGAPVTGTGQATVSITSPTPPPGPAPTITVDQGVDSLTKPAPGGEFLSSIVVTNTSPQPLTLVSLIDDDLNGKGTCTLPQPLAPAGTYSCTFPILFTGNAGDSRTFTTTATAVDAFGRQAIATDSIVLTLTAPPSPTPPPVEPTGPHPPGVVVATATAPEPTAPEPTAVEAAAPAAAAGIAAAAADAPAPKAVGSLARTGADPAGSFRLALTLVTLGLAALVVASVRRPALVSRARSHRTPLTGAKWPTRKRGRSLE